MIVKLQPNSPLYTLVVEMVQLGILLQDGNYEDHGLVGIRASAWHAHTQSCSCVVAQGGLSSHRVGTRLYLVSRKSRGKR